MDMVTGMATDMDMEMRARKNIKSVQPASIIGLCCFCSLAFAQSVSTGSDSGSAFSATNASAATQTPPSALGNSTSQGRAWVITPRIGVTETYSDNVNVNASNNNKQGDFTTEISPGIRVEARAARLKAYLDYTLRGLFYARESGYNQTQNSLNTFGTFEAVEKWLFLDFSALIAQQAISAFGPQSPSNSTINNNVTETATYRLSPYIRGQAGGLVDYLLRYNLSTTRSDASAVSDTNISEWTGQLRGSTPFRNLKWTIDGSQQSVDYTRGRDTDSERLRGMLTYSLSPQFRVSASAGQESNNYASLDQKTNDTYGYGFDWNPTERTQISAFKERRFFGDGHNVSFSHRFPRSSIRFSDTRDVSVLPNQFTTVGFGSVYDLFYPLLANVEPYASMPPGAKESAIANAIYSLFGVPANTQVTSSFLTSRATVQRRQQLGLTLTGIRNTITLMVSQGEDQSALASASSNDDFSQSNVVRQRGFSLNYSHRLSDISNLNALASRQESTNSGTITGTGNLKATTTIYQINLSTKLGAKTTGALSARRSEFDSATNPYTENAIIGSVFFVY